VDGWVKLYRSVSENWVWNERPFSKGQAWLDLIILANHKDNKFPLGDEMVMVERGSFITSELKLMERWGWSKSKVRLFLNQLQNDSMIVKKTDRKKTTINIVNYSVYQESETTEEPIKDHQQTDNRPIKDTNKNDKNDKNINTYSEIVNLYNQICISFPQCTKLSDARKKAIGARLKTYTLDDFKLMFELAEQSNFLKGKNDRNWSANFDWLIKDTNMAKVLDGNYKNKGDEKPSGQTRLQTHGDNDLDCAKAFAERFADEPIDEELPFMQ
jgi:hypothetical protein